MSAESKPPDRDYLVPEAEVELRVKALEALVVEKGLVSTDALDRISAHYEDEVGPRDGARVIARAWVDPAFKERLLADATAACEELGIKGLRGEHLRAVEDTPEVHNVVVCTLCSCYPWAVLGLPPSWYKSPEYRAKVVLEPRRTLADDFGFPVPEEVTVRVWDSNSELRYFVIPQHPEGTEHMSEAELAELVTREAMIGVGPVTAT
ncbi:MAG: nitrile hydratase subunit alpha [Nitriliruptorales bacterium]|nr:nitrile hydratase subunit alpha [Nitriliruptorales bacterium]